MDFCSTIWYIVMTLWLATTTCKSAFAGNNDKTFEISAIHPGDTNELTVDNFDPYAFRGSRTDNLAQPPYESDDVGKSSGDTRQKSFDPKPKSELISLTNALLHTILDHKIFLLTSLINALNWLLGGLIFEIRQFFIRIFGFNNRDQVNNVWFADLSDSPYFMEHGPGKSSSIPPRDRSISFEDVALAERFLYDVVNVFRLWKDK